MRNGDLGELESDVEMGQEITVMISEIDAQGRLNLSRRALFGDNGAPAPAQAQRSGGNNFDRGRRPGGFNGGRGGQGDRGRRPGGPGGQRGGPRPGGSQRPRPSLPRRRRRPKTCPVVNGRPAQERRQVWTTIAGCGTFRTRRFLFPHIRGAGALLPSQAAQFGPEPFNFRFGGRGGRLALPYGRPVPGRLAPRRRGGRPAPR